MIRDKAMAAIFFTLGLIPFLVGCRATPTGLGFHAAREMARRNDANKTQVALIGHSVDDAKLHFRDKDPQPFTDEASQDSFLFFRLFSFPGMDHSYVVRFGQDRIVSDVSGWLKLADGLEDVFKLIWIRGKVIGKPIAVAQKKARLSTPLLILLREGDDQKLFVFDVTNFTHMHPRLLRLTVDSGGVCRRAEYFGVVRGERLRLAHEKTESQ